MKLTIEQNDTEIDEWIPGEEAFRFCFPDPFLNGRNELSWDRTPEDLVNKIKVPRRAAAARS